MKPFFIITFLLFSFSSSAKLTEVIGEFVKIRWGDYQHLVIKVDKDEKSFWCLKKNTGIDCSELEKAPKKFAGKKLKITYKVEKKYIPQAGEEIEMKVVVSIDLHK